MTNAEMKSQIENTFNYFVKRQKSVTFWIDENAVVFEFDGKEKRKEFECRELAEWFIATLIALFEKEVESGVLQFKNSVKKFVTFPEKQKENNDKQQKQRWYHRKV